LNIEIIFYIILILRKIIKSLFWSLILEKMINLLRINFSKNKIENYKIYFFYFNYFLGGIEGNLAGRNWGSLRISGYCFIGLSEFIG
jgi:hypothetical protein